MYSSLMGTFDLLSPIAQIYFISSSKAYSIRYFFQNHKFLDPWPLPYSTTTVEEGYVDGMTYPMSAAEISYQFIINTTDFDQILLSPEDLDGDGAPNSSLNLASSLDYLDTFYHMRWKS